MSVGTDTALGLTESRGRGGRLSRQRCGPVRRHGRRGRLEVGADGAAGQRGSAQGGDPDSQGRTSGSHVVRVRCAVRGEGKGGGAAVPETPQPGGGLPDARGRACFSQRASLTEPAIFGGRGDGCPNALQGDWPAV